MGKVRRPARKHSNHHDAPRSEKPKVTRRQHSQPQQFQRPKHKSPKEETPKQQVRVKVPFDRYDNVLLVGEGDFSFSLALEKHHRTGHLTATCYDSKEVLESKYPDVQSTIIQLAPSIQKDDRDGDTSEWKGFSPPPPPVSPARQDDEGSADPETAVIQPSNVTVSYGIDATKLSSAHKKALRPHSPFTKIVFNFPHVGGLSTDVNRQVRYNQELLVGFFKSARPLLSSPTHPARITPTTDNDNGDEHDDFDPDLDNQPPQHPGAINGQILVTLFEGEPYTLWNIRDLARHCNLKVVESFKFPWSAYPGYRHARTVGEITTGKDRSDEGKRKGAWRGEERDARCYVLEDKDAEADMRASAKKRKRRTGEDDESD